MVGKLMNYFNTLIKHPITVAAICKFILFEKKWSLFPQIKLYIKKTTYFLKI